MNIRLMLLCLCFSLTIGCKTTSSNTPDLPPSVAGVVPGCIAESKSIILSKGIKLPKALKYTVILHPGTKDYGPNEGWGFNSPAHGGRPVMALTGLKGNSIYMELGCNPKTMTVARPIILHETAHYWMLGNYNDYRHDVRLRKSFVRWEDVPGYMSVKKNGDIEIVDFADETN